MTGPEQGFGGLFASVGGVGSGLALEAPEPAYFPDLRLDQLVAAVVAGRERHNLEPAFRARLDDPGAVERRQAVFADLGDDHVRSAMRSFCDGLERVEQLFAAAKGVRHPQRSQRLRLNAVAAYADVVDAAGVALEDSVALKDWADWLRRYRAGDEFTALATGARGLLAELGSLGYTLTLSGAEIVASPYAGQDDLGAVTRSTFERFADGEVPGHEFDLRAGAEMGQLHGAVLDLVVQLFPDVFARVAQFLQQHPAVRPAAIDVVERDLQFVLSWLDFIGPLQEAGLPFCLPDVQPAPAFEVTETFDVLLARKSPPVTNDAALGEGEQVLVVTGPNQGGKTTFARTVGQLYHLAALGLPVPGRTATLHPPDAILTHFDRGDRAGDLESRLEEEVTRMAGLLTEVSPRSVVILNEMFSSTTWVDARAMSTDVLRAVLDAGAVGVCVTFIDELSRLDPRVVSLVTGVDEHDVTARTFKVTRGRADGEAYAVALAAKYGLTRDQLLAARS